MQNKRYSLFVRVESTGEQYELDLEDIDLTTLYSVENLNDIEKRKDNFTKDFILKGTKNNNFILGFLYDISRFSSDSYNQQLAHNFVSNQYVKASLFENNIQIMDGKMLVKSYDIKKNIVSYNCAIVGNLFSFFKDLNERYLHELDSFNAVLDYNLDTVLASWDNPNSPYTFPSIDYGIDDRDLEHEIQYYDKAYDFKNFRPAIKVKAYLDAIFKGFRWDENQQRYTQFNELGEVINQYSYESSFVNSDAFKSLVIPFNEEEFVHDAVGKWSFIGFASGRFETALAKVRLFGNSEWGLDEAIFEQFLVENYHFDEANPSTVQPNVYGIRAVRENLRSTFSVKFTVTIKSGVGLYTIGLIDIKDRGYINSTHFVAKHQHLKMTEGDQVIEINIQVNEPMLFDSEYVFGIHKDGDRGINYESSFISIDLGVDSAVTHVTVLKDSQFNLLSAIPKDIKLVDFLKSLMTLFNLYIIPDTDNGSNFKIVTYSEFYKDVINLNPAVALDWSRKVDMDNIKGSNNIALPTQYNYTYESDSDVLNDKYSNKYQVTFGNATATNSKGVEAKKEIKVIFAPTMNFNHSVDTKNLPILYKSDDLLEGKKKPFKSKLRILYCNGTVTTPQYQLHYAGLPMQGLEYYNFCSMYRVVDGVLTDTLVFDIPYELFTRDYVDNNRSITLYTKYHSEQIKELINSNLTIMELEGYLNENDINALDFSRPIYIENQYGNSYWKLIDVNYKNAKVRSKIKLQKIVI